MIGGPDRSTVVLDPVDARLLVRDVLVRTGLGSRHAEVVATSLVAAELDGSPTHGLSLLPGYSERLRSGGANPTPHIVVAHEAGAVAVVDGDDALGQIVMDEVVGTAARVVRAHGVAVVAARRSNHLGALGPYVREAAARGSVAMLLQNIGPNMATADGSVRALGNAPFAIAVPGAAEPIVLDMCCSEVAGRRLVEAAAQERAVPLGWAVDAFGVPTTDPVAGLEGALLPLGGHKGAALATVLGALVAALPDALFGSQIPPARDRGTPRGLGHLWIEIAISRFGLSENVAQRVEAFADDLRELDPRARLPGRRARGSDVRIGQRLHGELCSLAYSGD